MLAKFRSRSSGFSLVEIAIVLVIVGIVVSFGLKGASAVRSGNDLNLTQTRLNSIQRALVLYVIRNGCLPCPADPATPSDGRAVDAIGTYISACGNATGGTSTACQVTQQGFVPWITLGLSRDEVIDGYGTMIDYAPDQTLTTDSVRLLRSTNPTTPYPHLGTIDVYDATPAQITSDAAYVLISHGPDKSGGYMPNSSTRMTDTHASALQSCNIRGGAAPTPACAGSYYLQNDLRGLGAAAYFDDIVRFSTAPIIIQSCGSNACGNPA